MHTITVLHSQILCSMLAFSHSSFPFHTKHLFIYLAFIGSKVETHSMNHLNKKRLRVWSHIERLQLKRDSRSTVFNLKTHKRKLKLLVFIRSFNLTCLKVRNDA